MLEQLAFSTNAFKKNTFDDALESIAAIGYQRCELMADMPHMTPILLDDAKRNAFATQVRSRGLVAGNINAFTGFFACGQSPGAPITGDTYHPTWFERDAKQTQLRIDHTLAAIRLAHAVGAKTVSLQPGGPVIGSGLSETAAGEMFAQSLSQCVPLARQLGITLAIEPEPGLLIETSSEYLAFKSRFFASEDAVMMNCDLGHLFCVGEDPAQVIRQCDAHIAHVHLEDIGKNRVHQHLTPGRGVMNFPGIFAALADIDYRGQITVELYPYILGAAGVAGAAYTHLRPMLD